MDIFYGYDGENKSETKKMLSQYLFYVKGKNSAFLHCPFADHEFLHLRIVLLVFFCNL